MNVNLHYKFQVWDLGMVRIFNSMPAEIAKDILEMRLREFDILLNDDVVALLTDGASVMKKMGTLSKPLHHHVTHMLSILQYVRYFMIRINRMILNYLNLLQKYC